MNPSRANIEEVQFSVPVDKQLTEGFAISAGIHILIFLLLIAYVLYDPPLKPVSQVPLELIRLGLGNGPGSGGNLSAPGDPMKGKTPDNPMEDASKQQQVKQKVDPAAAYESGKKVVASSVSDAQRAKDSANAHGKKNLGNPNGSPNGTGLRGPGNGPGSGLGFGIDWGGGGNRTVLNKKLPEYPEGANKNAQIKIMFTVNPDGSVVGMQPTQKGDPRMEEAAYKALRQWRFNAIASKDARPQRGEITFTFKAD